jgi:Protein of unknown function (DUF2752)
MKTTAVHLSSQERRLRIVALAAIAFAGFALRMIDPASLPWLPFRAPCGALTGLPCIFCGTTRALHYLLNGQFAQALYFNWLAFVVVATAVAIAFISATELLCRRRLVALPAIRLTRGRAAIGAAVLVTLWLVQVISALALHKHELLNSNGLLYAVFVR